MTSTESDPLLTPEHLRQTHCHITARHFLNENKKSEPPGITFIGTKSQQAGNKRTQREKCSMYLVCVSEIALVAQWYLNPLFFDFSNESLGRGPFLKEIWIIRVQEPLFDYGVGILLNIVLVIFPVRDVQDACSHIASKEDFIGNIGYILSQKIIRESVRFFEHLLPAGYSLAIIFCDEIGI